MRVIWRRFAEWLQVQSLSLEEVSSSVLSRYLHSLFVSGLSVSTLKSHRSVFSDLGRRFACSVLRVVDLKDSFWGPWQQGDESPVLLGLSHVCVLQRDPVAGQQVLVLRTYLSFKLRPNDLPRCRCQSRTVLCPVRSLGMYLNRTVEKHRSSLRLFVH